MRLEDGKCFGQHQVLNKKQRLSYQANTQNRFHIFGAAVLVFEIVCVFPDVDAVDRGATGH